MKIKFTVDVEYPISRKELEKNLRSVQMLNEPLEDAYEKALKDLLLQEFEEYTLKRITVSIKGDL